MAMKVKYLVINGEIISENRGGVERDYVPDSVLLPNYRALEYHITSTGP